MLNTESKSAALCIWSVIALIFLVAAWSAFKIPSPCELLAAAIASEAAKVIERFQILLGPVIGFTVLAAALYCNGARNRKAVALENETVRSNLEDALISELTDLEADCNSKARQAWEIAEEISNGKAGGSEPLLLPAGLYQAIASPMDTLLMHLTPESLSQMGSHIYGHVRHLRRQLRYLEDVIDDAPESEEGSQEEQAAFFKDLAHDYLAMSHACTHVREACSNGKAKNGGCCDQEPLIS